MIILIIFMVHAQRLLWSISVRECVSHKGLPTPGILLIWMIIRAILTHFQL